MLPGARNPSELLIEHTVLGPTPLLLRHHRGTLHSFTVTAIGWGEAQELLPPPPPPPHASNVSVGVGGVSSRWAQLLSFHQNTTGTGKGHPEFRIAKFHWKGSDDTCPRTKRSDRL